MDIRRWYGHGRIALIRDILQPISQRQKRHISTQEQLTNLGSVVDRIESSVPHLLYKPFSPDMLHPAVTLRVFPEYNALEFHGTGAYRMAVKIVQIWTSALLLPPGTQLVPISTHLSRESHIPDRKLEIHWRSSSQEKETRAPLLAPFSLGTGDKLRTLNLLPSEYPILVGTFEFTFPEACDSILVHTVRNLEYLAKPLPATA